MSEKRKAGRPKADIDWNRVGEMLEAGCFATGISASLGIDEHTLYNRCKTDNKCDFSTFRQQKLAKGDDMLRQAQFRAAIEDKSPTMQIWLGKQRLDQRDKSEHTGKDGADLIPKQFIVEIVKNDGADTSNTDQDQ